MKKEDNLNSMRPLDSEELAAVSGGVELTNISCVNFTDNTSHEGYNQDTKREEVNIGEDIYSNISRKISLT